MQAVVDMGKKINKHLLARSKNKIIMLLYLSSFKK